MYKITIIYASKYGQAKKCARILNNRIEGILEQLENIDTITPEVLIDTNDIKKITIDKLCETDCIVYFVEENSEWLKDEPFIKKCLINDELRSKRKNVILINIGTTKINDIQISNWMKKNIKVNIYCIKDYLDINNENAFIKLMHKIRYMFGIENELLDEYEYDDDLVQIYKKILELGSWGIIKEQVKETKRTFVGYIKDLMDAN